MQNRHHFHENASGSLVFLNPWCLQNILKLRFDACQAAWLDAGGVMRLVQKGLMAGLTENPRKTASLRVGSGFHNFFASWEEEKVCVFFSASPFSTTRKAIKRTLEKINSWHAFEVEVKSQMLIFCDTVPLLMLLILLFLFRSLKSRMCYLHMYRSIFI